MQKRKGSYGSLFVFGAGGTAPMQLIMVGLRVRMLDATGCEPTQRHNEAIWIGDFDPSEITALAEWIGSVLGMKAILQPPPL